VEVSAEDSNAWNGATLPEKWVATYGGKCEIGRSLPLDAATGAVIGFWERKLTGGMVQMNKMMTIGLVAVVAAGVASAENEVVMVGQAGGSDASQTKISTEVALVSSYVWRGQVYNNDMVVQPQITASQYGVSLNIWGNYDIGKNYQGTSSDFSEIDVSLAYTLPLDINQMSFDFGVINYIYPANGTGGVGKPSTTELFGTATVLSWKKYVIPSVTMFGDIDEANGVYFLFNVVAPYQISDYLSVEGGISAGYGNTSYNDYYFGQNGNGTGTQDAGINDYNFYGNASYEILDGLTVSVNLTYTMLEGGSIRSAAGTIYEAKEKLWGGVNVAYDF
jgi:outer membrane scaffolding protein for murein synthesis (MipA/OmpV family)